MLRPGECTEIVTELDIYKDSVCDREMFLKLTRLFHKPAPPAAELREAFLALDEDGSGSISAKELLHVLRALGEGISEDEAKELVRLADRDGDGEVDYQEFTKLLTTSLVSDSMKRFA